MQTAEAVQSLTITDEWGAVVRVQPVPAQQLSTEVPLHTLRPGVYFLTVRGANNIEVRKFIKQ